MRFCPRSSSTTGTSRDSHPGSCEQSPHPCPAPDARLNFAYYSDPNGNGNGDAATVALNATQWPAYGGETNMLSLKTLNVSLITDDYRQEQMQFFLDRPVDFNYKRDLHA